MFIFGLTTNIFLGADGLSLEGQQHSYASLYTDQSQNPAWEIHSPVTQQTEHLSIEVYD